MVPWSFMKNGAFSARIIGTALVTGLLLTACPGPIRPPLRVLNGSGPVFQEEFGALLRSSPENRPFRVLVDLTRQVDLLRLVETFGKQGLDKKSRRRSVIECLESVAAGQQEEMQPYLDRLLNRGVLDSVRPVAIVNRLIVDGSAAGILDKYRAQYKLD